ncbi:Uncharacterised protein [Mycobacteroides abscessus subsp. abscessus]|nr:Uncharacterised protein [Mycobacteroides abscessus]SIG75649.1 Uncharacterised protein [Mycobacteroides abscessus subsp. abscessus]SIN53226.1 Uncharacterised protein [Mycobacteroides abscessus subsp. abscessus]SKR23336.1 Uncharacterised protein [Mycobacteroides abscessus subsp. abscessus]
MLGFIAVFVVVVALFVFALGAAMRHTGLLQADISLGPKGLTIHLRQHPMPGPPGQRKRRRGGS